MYQNILVFLVSLCELKQNPETSLGCTILKEEFVMKQALWIHTKTIRLFLKMQSSVSVCLGRRKRGVQNFWLGHTCHILSRDTPPVPWVIETSLLCLSPQWDVIGMISCC